MFLRIIGVFAITLVCHLIGTDAQSYEDARCKCVCTITNGTQTNKTLYVTSVPTNNNCLGIMAPVIDTQDNKTKELCPHCNCKYESRNTTIIKVVVIIVIWIISLLVIYMLFLICLDPLLNKRVKSNYIEHTNEEDDSGGSIAASAAAGGLAPGSSSHQMGVRSGNVLNRMGHQQNKWKKQVREQRKNIYDRHTMLN